MNNNSLRIRGAPLLSICIPTYNRPDELAETLRILAEEVSRLPQDWQLLFEIYVSDNDSPDKSVRTVAEKFKDSPLCLTYACQPKNVGPTLNFESCYRHARGEYVFILSDDDHLTEGALTKVVQCLLEQKPDIVFLPIVPQTSDGPDWVGLNRDAFLEQVSFLPTLISACIVKRDLIVNDLGRYLDTNLHHYYYFLVALDRGEKFISLRRQILYCPYEGNAGGYNWFVTFAGQLPRILREFVPEKIGKNAIAKVRKDLLIEHILRIFVKKRVTGYTFNQNFKNESNREVFRLVSSNFSKVPAFYYAFLPLYLMPVGAMRLLKRVYLAIR